jgi:adenosylcobinamide-GDP ribazoletransferase
MTAFAAAVRLLTIIPLAARSGPDARAMARSPVFFPLVGLGVGAAMAGVDRAALLVMPPLVAAGLAVLATVVLTGAIHLDGLADAADGLFGGRTPERRLEIMRDPRTGAFGVIAVAVALILKTGAVSSFTVPHSWAALLVSPALARLAAVAVMSAFPYARQEGLGAPYRAAPSTGMVRRASLALALLFSAVSAYALAGPWAMAALGVALAVGLAAGAFAASRLGGGVTGDIYGAAVETAETAALLSFTGLVGAGVAVRPVWA